MGSHCGCDRTWSDGLSGYFPQTPARKALKLYADLKKPTAFPSLGRPVPTRSSGLYTDVFELNPREAPTRLLEITVTECVRSEMRSACLPTHVLLARHQVRHCVWA